jgi:hypothetical protein
MLWLRDEEAAMKAMRAITIVMLLVISSLARAGELRCGERLVDLGNTTGEVVLKCGPPTYAERSDTETATLETWTYNLGPHDFIRTLTFVDGWLNKIETGDYGR